MSIDYTTLSDFEINKLVAEILYPEAHWVKGTHQIYLQDHARVCIGDEAEGSLRINDFDYCNNPSDIMPIAIENKISLHYCDDGDWLGVESYTPKGEMESEYNKNPYRAIAEVYLKMQEATV